MRDGWELPDVQRPHQCVRDNLLYPGVEQHPGVRQAFLELDDSRLHVGVPREVRSRLVLLDKRLLVRSVLDIADDLIALQAVEQLEVDKQFLLWDLKLEPNDSGVYDSWVDSYEGYPVI